MAVIVEQDTVWGYCLETKGYFSPISEQIKEWLTLLTLTRTINTPISSEAAWNQKQNIPKTEYKIKHYRKTGSKTVDEQTK